MNILLTGEVGIGKSEIINRVLIDSGVHAGGVITKFINRARDDRKLFIMDLKHEIALEAVAFNPGRAPEVNIDVFNDFGSELVDRSKEYDLAVIDELGFFENNADKFKNAIFELLSGESNVLGVIKLGYRGWLDDIRAREDVNIITVTRENREEMHEHVLALLGLNSRDARQD